METNIFKYKNIKILNVKTDSKISFVGVCLLAGSNYENEDEHGIAHFSEHMFFKGTKKRKYNDINMDMARIGGDANAYTDNTEIMFHTTVPQENLKYASEILSDMIFNSNFDVDEMEKERKVILEEIKMYDDVPAHWFYRQIGNHMFSREFGHPTIGDKNSVSSFTRDSILKYFDRTMNINNIMFIFVGNNSDEDIKRILDFSNIPDKHPYLKNGSENLVDSELWSKKSFEYIDGTEISLIATSPNIQQSHISMSTPWLSTFDNLYLESKIISYILGGGLYSYLSKRIREELGLCYSVGFSSISMDKPHVNIGNFWAGTNPESVDLIIEESNKIFNEIKKNGIDKDIFECARYDYYADLLKSMDNSRGIAFSFVKFYIRNNKIIDFNEIYEKCKSLSLDTCNELSNHLLSNHKHWAIMNPE